MSHAETPVVSPTTTAAATCQEIKPKIQDFKVKIHDSTILFPIQETERKSSYFLSNLDQIFDFPMPTVYFFSVNPDFPFETVVERLKTAVQKVLVPYDFYAGRVRQNHQLGRLEIDCNGAGVGFVVASSEFSLGEIGDLVYPNPGNRRLVWDYNFGPNGNDQPLCIFQVTSFKCGGFSLGFTVNHLCCDANGGAMFMNNVASQTFEGKRPLAVIPCHDRHLLAARSPPRVEFPHPELILPPFNESNDNSTLVEKALVSKIFKLSLNQINYLKDKAKPPSSYNTTSGTKPVKITSFNVAAALVWRCKALSSIHDLENDDHKDTVVCTLNTAVDVRSRLNLPPSYSGNAIIYAYASLKCIEFEEKPFCEIVRVISDGITGSTDEYVRSTIDWYEINKLGKPNQGYFISALWKVGLEQAVYPWGKPICCLPVRVNNVCFVIPPAADHSNDKGMNLVVTLPPKEMDKFQTLFYDFLKNKK